MKPRDTVVALDCFPAPGALAVAVALHPVVGHRLRGLLTLHVGSDAGGRRSLHAPLVHRVFADCTERRREK